MLITEERRQLKNLLELLDGEEEKTNRRDVSNRSRDKKGRFAIESEHQVEVLPSSSVRKIKLMKVKGSYGSYFVRTQRLTDGEKDSLLLSGVLMVLAILF